MNNGGPADMLRRLVERLTGTLSGPEDDEAASTDLPPLAAPAVSEATSVIIGQLEELNKTGALDEGNAAVLDQLIHSWVEQWIQADGARHQSARNRADRQLREAEVLRDSYQPRIEKLEQEIARLERQAASVLARSARASKPAPPASKKPPLLKRLFGSRSQTREYPDDDPRRQRRADRARSFTKSRDHDGTGHDGTSMDGEAGTSSSGRGAEPAGDSYEGGGISPQRSSPQRSPDDHSYLVRHEGRSHEGRSVDVARIDPPARGVDPPGQDPPGRGSVPQQPRPNHADADQSADATNRGRDDDAQHDADRRRQE